VSVSGEAAVVGAYFEDYKGTSSGSAYVFTRDGSGNWSHLNKIFACDGQAYDRFGFSVALDGHTVVSGAPVDNNSGSAYLFDLFLGHAPEIQSLDVAPDLTSVDHQVTATVNFCDLDLGSGIVVAFDWGDGQRESWPVTAAECDPGSQSLSATHEYDEAGIYTVNVTITDEDGRSDSESFRYVVIYDPSGGFVTGGGWIDSPLGAYPNDETLTGKANFGFVSKYKKGASVPTGNTEFEFKVADLNFKSTSYDWLVIAGDNARYKGEGTINGEGSYNFMLWGGDGTPDTFRIKIWTEDEATAVETDIYDNGFDQELGGGSVVIHKPK
jgi:hypothetical protein